MLETIKSLVKGCISSDSPVEIEIPKNEQFGDYATNIALLIAKQNKKKPSEIADEIASAIKAHDKKGIFSSVTSTPQGFINFKLNDTTINAEIKTIIKNERFYGNIRPETANKILLEFVSANPTGPLHIGHGRWAVIGDCLANILKAAGHTVTKEFYINDAGEQVSKLEASVAAKMAGLEIPENGYAGSYVQDIANSLKEEGFTNIRQASIELILNEQKETLSNLGVTFDIWYSESELHKNGLIKVGIKKLEDKGLTFTESGALWFRSMPLGDDKNRVLIKEDGSSTYFAADIAYHINKFDRGFNKLINIWGTDHHGYVPRLKAALKALGYPSENFEVILGQLVALYRGKELVRMSKRTGDMITLEEVIEEIGRDATRYFLAKNSPNTHLDFDLELAKSKTLDNPVYYVSYAHARICSIISEAKKAGFDIRNDADLSKLSADIERKLMLKLIRFPDEVAVSAKFLQPHRLTTYAEELAALFHNYYHQQRVITEDKETTYARLFLIRAASIVLKNVLKLLGITAPDKM